MAGGNNRKDSSRLSSAVKYRKGEGWCSRSLLRNYLYIFNFFFVIGGGIVLAVGIWSIWTEHEFLAALSGVTHPVTSYLLVGAGIMVAIATVIGCIGICRSDRCFLLLYVVLLFLILFVEAYTGILAYVYREQSYHNLQQEMNHTFSIHYGIDRSKTVSVDKLHQEFRCCGAVSYQDWHNSTWKLTGLAGNNNVPDSCCITVIPACGIREHPSRIFPVGCIHKLKTMVRDQLGYLCITGLGLCVLQVFGIIFTTCLFVKLKSPDITDL